MDFTETEKVRRIKHLPISFAINTFWKKKYQQKRIIAKTIVEEGRPGSI